MWTFFSRSHARVLGALLCAVALPRTSHAQPPPEAAVPESAPLSTEMAEASAPPVALRIPTLVASNLAKLGCSVADAVAHQGRYYAVCGQGAVWVVQAGTGGTLEVVARHRVGGTVRSLFVQADQVWVVSARETAEPLADAPLDTGSAVVVSQAAQAPALAPAKPAGEPGSFGVPGGTVLASYERSLVISIGKGEGLHVGDHVQIYRVVTPSAPGPLEEPEEAEEDDQEAARERTELIGEVIAVSPQRARVALGFGETARTGMRARKTNLPLTASRIAPARIGQLLILEASVRPFLPIAELGFAVLGDFAATYLSRIDTYVRAEVRPLGVLLSRNAHDAGVFGAYASAGYDQTYFSLGVGIGAVYFGKNTVETKVTGDTANVVSGGITTFTTSYNKTTSDVRLSVLQQVRLGSRDGLHFASSSAVRLDDKNWSFGWFEGAVQIPAGRRSWFVVHASGGTDPGFVYSELGFRRMLRGNGGAGSLFLRPSAGFSGISSPRHGSDFVFGPMIGLQLEARTGH